MSSDLSSEALDLLKTLKRIKPIKTWGIDFIDKRTVLLEYGYKQQGKELDALFEEVVNQGYVKKIQSGAYQLLAKANNFDFQSKGGDTIFSGNFHGSPIANNSNNVHQAVDMSSYTIEIQNEVAELQDAIKTKDSSRAKRIVDGLWVSAPALVLQLLQIGLGAGIGQIDR